MLKDGCRKPVLGVWVEPSLFRPLNPPPPPSPSLISNLAFVDVKQHGQDPSARLDESKIMEYVLKLVEVLLYVHRNRRFIRDVSPGRPP